MRVGREPALFVVYAALYYADAAELIRSTYEAIDSAVTNERLPIWTLTSSLRLNRS